MLSKLLIYTAIIVAIPQFIVASGLFIPPRPPIKKTDGSTSNEKKSLDEKNAIESVPGDSSSPKEMKKEIKPPEKKN